MKKQIKSVSTWSVKSGFTVTVLCAILGATEVNANNNLTSTMNSGSKGNKTEVKEEIVTNRNNSPWVLKNIDQNAKEQIANVITHWMSDGTYWSSDDSLVNDQQVSNSKANVSKMDQRSDNLKAEHESNIINAKSYIAGFKF